MAALRVLPLRDTYIKYACLRVLPRLALARLATF